MLKLDRNNGTTNLLLRRNEAPRCDNRARSEDRLIRKEHQLNERGQFISSGKQPQKSVDLDVRMVSYEEFTCYDNSNVKPVHINIEDQIRLYAREEPKLTPETGSVGDNNDSQLGQHMRKSKRVHQTN